MQNKNVPHIKTHKEKRVAIRPNQMLKKFEWTYDIVLWEPFLLIWCQSIIIARIIASYVHTLDTNKF
jgi:predicted transcriptional regulator